MPENEDLLIVGFVFDFSENSFARPFKFNTDDYEAFLHKLMEKSMHIPRVIFSFGGPKVDGKRLLEIVQQHRPAKLYEIQHKWSITATKESMQTATEILVVTK